MFSLVAIQRFFMVFSGLVVWKGLVFSYLLSYFFINFFFCLILWYLVLGGTVGDTSQLGTTLNYVLLLSLVFLVFILAGLPPFIFFFFKLSVVSLVVSSTSWVFVFVFLAFVGVCWIGYYRFSSLLLSGTRLGLGSKPTTPNNSNSFLVYFLILLLLHLCFFYAFVLDISLVSQYLLTY